MGKSAPAAPTPPDPYATARAQTTSNVATSIANSVGGNPDVYSPLGTSTFSQKGTYQVKTPHYDRDGNPVYTNADGSTAGGAFGGSSGPGEGRTQMFDYQDVPMWENHITLSPEQQKLYDQQTALGTKLNSLATGQADRLNGVLNSPLNLDGLPDQRAKYEKALFDRLSPQLDHDRNALESKLVNQGLARGTGAFNSALDESNRQANDARLAIVGAGGQEQANDLQMALAARNQPINEITALMSGGQVSMPQFQPFQAGSVAGTPVGDYVYKTGQMEQDNYKTQTAMNANNNSIFGQALGGLFGLGAKLSDRRLKRDIRKLGVRLPNGLDLYAYRYAGGTERDIGVMADEVRQVVPEAVIRLPSGFDAVNYAMVL